MTCTHPVRRTDCRSKAVRLFGRQIYPRSVLVGASWNLQMAIGEMASAVLFIPNKRSRIVSYLFGVNLWGEWYLKLTRRARLVKGILSGYRLDPAHLLTEACAVEGGPAEALHRQEAHAPGSLLARLKNHSGLDPLFDNQLAIGLQFWPYICTKGSPGCGQKPAVIPMFCHLSFGRASVHYTFRIGQPHPEPIRPPSQAAVDAA